MLLYIVYELYQCSQFVRTGFQIVIVNKEFCSGRSILTCILKRFDCIVLTKIISPVEVLVRPIQAQSGFRRFHRFPIRFLIGSVTHKVSSNASPLTIIRYRFIYHIPRYYPVAAMFHYTFYPSFHCSQQGFCLFLRTHRYIGNTTGTGCFTLHSLFRGFLFSEFNIINVVNSLYRTKINQNTVNIFITRCKLNLALNPFRTYIKGMVTTLTSIVRSILILELKSSNRRIRFGHKLENIRFIHT